MPITGASEFMNWLQKKQRPFVLATNCPSRTPEQIVEKLDRLGIKTRTNQILTSGISAARYLYSHGFRRVFLVGESAAQQALEQHGIIVTQQRPQCVLVAWDRSFSYSTLNCTLRFLMEGLPLFAQTQTRRFLMGTHMLHIQEQFVHQLKRLPERKRYVWENPILKWQRVQYRCLGLQLRRFA